MTNTTDSTILEAARQFAAVEWREVAQPELCGDATLPYVTHEGEFVVGSLTLKCVQLSDGRCVIDADSLSWLFNT